MTKPLMALTIYQPDYDAYLAGVILGDGYCTKRMGLKAKDKDFVEQFAVALRAITGRTINVRRDSGYWCARTSNRTGFLDYLRSYEPSTDRQKALWIRGMFDSEGNAQLTQKMETGIKYGRRVAMYNTNRATISRIQRYLLDLGIATRTHETKNSIGHFGTKPVVEIAVRCSRYNFLRFNQIIGSSIERKRESLTGIIESYHPDPAGYCRSAQLKGARTKAKRVLDEKIPRFAARIKTALLSGVKPTARLCLTWPDYYPVIRNIRLSVLVARIKKEIQLQCLP